MTEPFLSIEHLSHRFGGRAVVTDVNLTVGRGEFFSLLGPSGCGKTTLLRIIGGFVLPDFGRVKIAGEDMTLMPPEKRPVNMVFQSYAIFPHLNVAENIAYGLRAERLGAAERERRVVEALQLISLPGYGRRRAHELSGGERQRVALARALVKRPKLLLLDEPLGALDRRLRQDMQLELRQIQRQVGITFVFVTHDQEEALAMSDRVAVMQDGRILQVSDPLGLYESPNSQAVASFIGTMNFFNAKITGTENGSIIVEVEPWGALPLPARPEWDFTAASKVTAAIRPENIILSRTMSDGAAKGRVQGVTYLGDRSLARIELDAAGKQLTATAATKPGFFGAGDAVYVSLAAAKTLLLRQ